MHFWRNPDEERDGKVGGCICSVFFLSFQSRLYDESFACADGVLAVNIDGRAS